MRNKYIKVVLWTILPAVAIILIQSKFSILINTSESLPKKVFLLSKRSLPSKHGDYIVYELPNNKRFGDQKFIKLVGGIEGQELVVKDKNYYIDGKFLGVAKKSDASGISVELQPEGIVPEGHYFAYTLHKDSYDSKYKEVGFISSSNVLGTAYAIY
jgi:conjugal transfer pilin signal peptidase TrbI